MKISALRLRNFRCFNLCEIAFSPTINLFLGDNGTGKSSALEALYLLSAASSFRTARLQELIKTGQEEEPLGVGASHAFTIQLEFEKYAIDQQLHLSYSQQERIVRHNSTEKRSLQAVQGTLLASLVTVDDIAIIRGQPLHRRLFLDRLLGQLDPLYCYSLQRYARAMKQRNQLLRTGAASEIASWEELMASAASYIASQRLSLISQLNEAMSALAEKISLLQPKEFSIVFTNGFKGSEELSPPQIKELYQQRWFAVRSRDSLFGATTAGPHRDEFTLLLNGLPLRQFGSEGQQRLALLVLRLAEWQLLYKLSGELPLLLIDDFGTGLDLPHREALQRFLPSLGQTILTSCDRTLEAQWQGSQALYFP